MGLTCFPFPLLSPPLTPCHFFFSFFKPRRLYFNLTSSGIWFFSGAFNLKTRQTVSRICQGVHLSPPPTWGSGYFRRIVRLLDVSKHYTGWGRSSFHGVLGIVQEYLVFYDTIHEGLSCPLSPCESPGPKHRASHLPLLVPLYNGGYGSSSLRRWL